MKNARPIKTGKKVEQRIVCRCIDYTHNFKPQEIKMSFQKNQTALFVDLVNQDF